MQSDTVEAADRISRRRAILVALAALVFVASQVLGHPGFGNKGASDLRFARSLAWAVNAVLLLALLATGGGLLNRREIRRLVNDDVSRMNYRTSIIGGFWVAMISALALYVIPAFATFTARQASYIVVTLAVAVTSLTFAWMELRAHRNG